MSYTITVETETELRVVTEAITVYHKMMERLSKETKFLESKEFHIGDIVTKTDSFGLDSMFGIKPKVPCKIVGWDFEQGYYRVYYNSNNPYIGVKESELTKYEGEISMGLLQHDPDELDMLVLRF